MQAKLGRRRVQRAGAFALMGMLLAGCVAAPPQRHYDVSSDVLFDFGKADLKPAAAGALHDILGQIMATYRAPVIVVQGHTDAIGSDTANDALSLRRANSVRSWLIAAGVAPQAIQAQGMGRRQPVAPNRRPDGGDDPAGRAANRRVEIVASETPSS